MTDSAARAAPKTTPSLSSSDASTGARGTLVKCAQTFKAATRIARSSFCRSRRRRGSSADAEEASSARRAITKAAAASCDAKDAALDSIGSKERAATRDAPSSDRLARTGFSTRAAASHGPYPFVAEARQRAHGRRGRAEDAGVEQLHGFGRDRLGVEQRPQLI